MSSIVNTLAFWRPALTQTAEEDLKICTDQAGIGINTFSIDVRTGVIAAAAIALYTQALVYSISLAPLCMAVALTLPPIWRNFEYGRATRRLNEIAVNFFIQNLQENTIPEGIMNYLAYNPEAVQKLLNHAKCDLDKLQAQRGFVKYVIDQIKNESRLLDEDRLLEVFKLLVDKQEICLKTESFDYFLEILKADKNYFSRADYAKYVLEKEKINLLEECTGEEHFAYWQAVENAQIADLLVKRCNINAQNEEKETPLLEAIKKENISRMTFLLKNGAELPSGGTVIQIKTEEGIKSEVLDKFVLGKPKIHAIFEQATCRLYRSSNPIPNPIPSFKSSLCAIWKPAIDVEIKTHTFEISKTTISMRVLLVAIPIFSMIPAVAILAPSYLPLFAVACLPLYGYHRYEWSRATKALNDLAIQEFRNMFPAREVTKYMIRQEAVMDQLIKDRSDLDCLNEKGETLLDCLLKEEKSRFNSSSSSLLPTQYSIFKKLVDQTFQSKLSVEQKHAYFIAAIESGCLEYVQYLLDRHISVIEFSQEQKFEWWIRIKNTGVAQLLHAEGLNPNVKNALGYTPLFFVLSNLSKCMAIDQSTALGKALIEVGAQLNYTIKIQSTNKKGEKIICRGSVEELAQNRLFGGKKAKKIIEHLKMVA